MDLSKREIHHEIPSGGLTVAEWRAQTTQLATQLPNGTWAVPEDVIQPSRETLGLSFNKIDTRYRPPSKSLCTVAQLEALLRFLANGQIDVRALRKENFLISAECMDQPQEAVKILHALPREEKEQDARTACVAKNMHASLPDDQ